MTDPDLLVAGADDARRRAVSPFVRRVGWLAALLVAGVVVATSPLSGSATPEKQPDPDSSSAADVAAVEPPMLSVDAARDALARDVPETFRDAAGAASAMRGGRTPGNFFLAVAYTRTLYGAAFEPETGEPLVARGPVQWDPQDFRRYDAPGNRDIRSVLDSFLALDRAVHQGRRADFSNGAFGPARRLGMTTSEARTVAEVYDVLDGYGVRDALPN